MPDLIIFPNLEACVTRLVSDISACLQNGVEKRGYATMAVSGGRTPEHIFPLLSKAEIPWNQISITLADERWVEPDHPDSNEGLARHLLMKGEAARVRFVGLKTKHSDPFDGYQECEAALSTLNWPLDGILLGMGEDGHIASLFPGQGEWADATGRVLAVGASKQRQPRMSLTPGALLDSCHIFLVITGPEKQAILKAAQEPGPVDELPVRLILHQTQVPVTVYSVN